MSTLKDLRYRFQQRRDAVLKSDFNSIKANVHYYLAFIEGNPLLKSVSEELAAHRGTIIMPESWLYEGKARNRGSIPTFDNDVQLACFCQELLNLLLNSKDEGLGIIFEVSLKSHIAEQVDDFNEKYLMPFHQYIDERVDDFNSTLYLLQKYKYACEWFERCRLYNIYKSDESRGEANLDRDLRKFLFLQGIDYPFSSPLSASGRADVIAELDTDHPLVLEIKIFDLDKSYDKGYIRKGFRQAYDYSNDYNEPVSYLFIFKNCERDLVFNLKESSMPHKVIFGDKTIFIIQADIFVHDKSASEKKKLDPYVIDEDYLTSSD